MRLSLATSITPPADRLLVSQGCHAAAALSRAGGHLEGESKGHCWQNGWFSAKRYLLLSPWGKTGRMDLLQSHLLLGGWSATGGIGEDMKPQGFNGCICERPVGLHHKVKAILGILFISFWSKFKGSFLTSSVRADVRQWKLGNASPGCFWVVCVCCLFTSSKLASLKNNNNLYLFQRGLVAWKECNLKVIAYFGPYMKCIVCPNFNISSLLAVVTVHCSLFQIKNTSFGGNQRRIATKHV